MITNLRDLGCYTNSPRRLLKKFIEKIMEKNHTDVRMRRVILINHNYKNEYTHLITPDTLESSCTNALACAGVAFGTVPQVTVTGMCTANTVPATRAFRFTTIA